MTAQILFITGTDTDVGKTIATAATAATLATRPSRHGQPGSPIAIYKPVQTGVTTDEPGDIDVIRRLSGIASATEGIRLQRPMAPAAAAQQEGVSLPTLAEHAARIEDLTRSYNHVLVEGSGGLLVHLDDTHTIADLASHFGHRAAVIVVCRSGLGTLNHTELTKQALEQRLLHIAGLIIGSWPNQPDDIALDNHRYLSALDVPLLGAIPARASQLEPQNFRANAPSWFTYPL
ncbi:MAG: dethiobiotin synthase [Actinobacteria bacterium]|nr:dethiobiotin synthase [Actinomycetota bacterium]